MEALLEKEGDVENWNDDRLDELSRRIDAGFKEMRDGFARIDRRFEQMGEHYATKDETNRRFDKLDSQLLHINDRLDRMNNTLLIGTFGVIAALIANAIFG
ncbi:MAG TPA: hypothetical protein VNN15_05100 [Solirubrobacterales bacterium]|nr:hypothetical protein [Solirubrobacterales bacterium]